MCIRYFLVAMNIWRKQLLRDDRYIMARDSEETGPYGGKTWWQEQLAAVTLLDWWKTSSGQENRLSGLGGGLTLHVGGGISHLPKGRTLGEEGLS